MFLVEAFYADSLLLSVKPIYEAKRISQGFANITSVQENQISSPKKSLKSRC